MKTILALFTAVCLSLSFATDAEAKRVRGYVKKNGTYVAPHHRTNKNHTQRDNYSSKPNTNPYTGKQGTKEPKK